MMDELPEKLPIIEIKSRYEWLAMTIKQVLIAILFMIFGALYSTISYQLFAGHFSNYHLTHVRPADRLMNLSFLVGIPFVVAGLLFYYASYAKNAQARPLWFKLIVYTAFPLSVFIAGALLGEGIICILMASPILIAAAVLGVGIARLVMWFFGYAVGKKLSLAALLLPYLLVSIEQEIPSPIMTGTIDDSVHIAASPHAVFNLIENPHNIQPSEIKDSFIYTIGLPYPVGAKLQAPAVGAVRHSEWQRGVKFDEILTAYEPDKYIAWKYRFAADSFPPGSLDDHVKIGGEYFDLSDTSYRLIPEAGGTRLDLHTSYRIGTHFNAYANIWAKWFIGDAAGTILNFYKNRAEAPHEVTELAQ